MHVRAMKKSAFALVPALLIQALISVPTQAGTRSMIEIVADQPSLNATDLLQSPGYLQDPVAVASRAHRKIDETPGLDETLKSTLHMGLNEVLDGRILDIQVAFLTGFPDLAAICLEGHIDRHVAIEACASTAVIVSAISIATKYRWDLVVKQSANGHVHQLSAGPGFGFHLFFGTSWMGGSGDAIPDSGTIDVVGSLEYVFWISRHFGFTTQLDIGPSLVLKEPVEDNLGPMGMARLTFGLAF